MLGHAPAPTPRAPRRGSRGRRPGRHSESSCTNTEPLTPSRRRLAIVGQPGAAPSSRSKPPERTSSAVFHHSFSAGFFVRARFVDSISSPPSGAPVDALPDVDDLGPAAGRAHHVERPEQLEAAARRRVHVEPGGVLHVAHRAFADDVDVLVQEQVSVVRHGAGHYRTVPSRHAVRGCTAWRRSATCCATRHRSSRPSSTPSRSPARSRYALDLPVPPPGSPRRSARPAPRSGGDARRARGAARSGRSTGCARSPRPRNIGVANTWGAKGVFAWDSPHHLGTCGLQAHDFELLGFADLDLLWVTGLDPDESPARALRAGAARRADRARRDLGRVRRPRRALVVPDRAPAVVRAPRRGRAAGLRRRALPAPSRPRGDRAQAVDAGRAGSSPPIPGPRASGSPAPSRPTGRAPSSSPRSAQPGIGAALGVRRGAGRPARDRGHRRADRRHDPGARRARRPATARRSTVEVWGDDVDLVLTDCSSRPPVPS